MPFVLCVADTVTTEAFRAFLKLNQLIKEDDTSTLHECSFCVNNSIDKKRQHDKKQRTRFYNSFITRLRIKHFWRSVNAKGNAAEKFKVLFYN